jgi:1,4-alpha-glucan branching enzyme
LGSGAIQRVVLPKATSAQILTATARYVLEPVDAHGIFIRKGSPLPTPYRLLWQDSQGNHERYDPYLFSPVLDRALLARFNGGTLVDAFHHLGGQRLVHEGAAGLFFSVWAPHAIRVSVVGSFNGWNPEFHPLRPRGTSGVWELFIPELEEEDLDYQFSIKTREGAVLLRADPYGRAFEMRPGLKARIPEQKHLWQDAAWLERRKKRDWQHQPLLIYEMHFGSWKQGSGAGWPNYREVAPDLIRHCRSMGYTHIELLPILEHPLDESWGYQATGYFAPTSRYGTPDDFRALVDACHDAGLGVILDWVPAHFPHNEGALSRFDGAPLYEYADLREGVHPDWGTLIFNFGRPEVRSFLLSSAVFWLEEFHLDGLRVDAVSSMLYRDYSRGPGEWIPNRLGGHENLEAVSLLRMLTGWAEKAQTGVLLIAEESSAWPKVTHPAHEGGLGFSLKWNLGWFHDTVNYLGLTPPARSTRPRLLTFNRMYAFTERFLLPLSHDEVTQGKGPLIDKMPGRTEEAMANLRLFFVYQMFTPGKKLCFMGNEFGASREWNLKGGLDWKEAGQPPGSGILRLNRKLGQLYAAHPPLYDLDSDERGFEWIDCPAPGSAVVAFARLDQKGSRLIGIFNFSRQAVCDYPIRSPGSGSLRLLLNSDWIHYGGRSRPGQPHLRTGQSVTERTIDLPPLTALLLDGSGLEEPP